jgi:TonB family protein
MKKLILLFFVFLFMVSESFAVSSYVKVSPQLLTSEQTSNYETVNETLSIIFGRLKSYVNTDKYPKYYHDFTLVKDDGTQNSSYYYVKNSDAELIYNADTNELKYVSFRRPELQKCRIIYDYPSGKLYAVQVYASDKEVFVFSPDGKYVDYEPYANGVREKVKKSWKVPSRKRIDALAKDKKDLLVQIALTVNKDGTVKQCRILKSSKIKELDDNAGEAIKAAVPFNPFPENFFNEELVIILNFNFSL